MSELVLVRHGQASFGADSYDKLSALGLRQAQVLAEHWRALGESFDQIYSGELIRQQETAACLLDLVSTEPALRIHPGFNEYDGNPLIRIYLRDHARNEGFPADVEHTMKDRKTFQLVLEATTRHWIEGTLQPADEDSDFERWQDFRARVHGALDELMLRHTGGSRILIATSGGVIAVALQRALQLQDNQTIAANWMVNNSSVTRLVYGRGKVSLATFNSLAHLERPDTRDMVTFR